ncbi:MAG: paraquat-inducible protein A [Nitratireductor sp.]|nr:paraquat-inducible protein A [Nitratireductor sp.]MCB1455436.1 paraquat-inducible protein A [Nitratireductor sp.]MCB1458862.1 paraquat-inducible protein A [Nitratireductor sp.]
MIDRFRPALLMIAAISFGLGISLPLIRFEKLYFFAETPSLLRVVEGLWTKGDWGLAALVGAFSLAFPVIKMFTVYEAAFRQGRFPAWAGFLSKWSMMDVLLVAILVFAAKTSGLATAVSQPGIWFFALSTVATAIASVGIEGDH